MTQTTQFMANNTALMSFTPFSHFPPTNFRSACQLKLAASDWHY